MTTDTCADLSNLICTCLQVTCKHGSRKPNSSTCTEHTASPHMTREIQRTLDLRGLYAIMSCKNQYMDIFSNLHDDYKAGWSLYALECISDDKKKISTKFVAM